MTAGVSTRERCWPMWASGTVCRCSPRRSPRLCGSPKRRRWVARSWQRHGRPRALRPTVTSLRVSCPTSERSGRGCARPRRAAAGTATVAAPSRFGLIGALGVICVLGAICGRTLAALGRVRAAAGRPTGVATTLVADGGTATLRGSPLVVLTRLPEVLDLLGGKALAGPTGLGQPAGGTGGDAHLLVEVLGG